MSNISLLKFSSFIKDSRPFLRAAAIGLLGMAAFGVWPGLASAAYPDSAIRMVVAWPAGSTTDIVARLVSERLSQKLGQPVVVENRPGASGAIGTTHVARSKPDGYTLIFATADTHSINPHIYSNLKYDAVKDFEPISLVGTVDFILMQRADLPYDDFKAFRAAAQESPEKFSYGTWGRGSTAHIGFLLIEKAADIKLLHVPFQGAEPAQNALLGSHVDLMLTGVRSGKSLGEAGKVKILAVSGDKRSAMIPNVPTFKELGFPDAKAGSWYGVMAPAGIPDDVRNKLAAEMAAIVHEPEIVKRLAEFGWNPVGDSPAEYRRFLDAEYARFGDVIRASNIKVE